MNVVAVVIAVIVVALILAALSIRVVTQYEKGVLFRLGRVKDVREPGLRFIIPVIDRLRKVSMRIVTMPIQSQGIITRDNVSVDISAVAYFRVVDAVKSVVAIENVAPRSIRSPRRRCAMSSASTPSTRRWQTPRRSTPTSGRSSM